MNFKLQNNIQVEHDIKQLVTESKTYADTLKIVAENTVEGSYKEPMDIRSIVREAKNEEIAQNLYQNMNLNNAKAYQKLY